MVTIKKHNKNQMLDIVLCGCGHEEYYGDTIMRNRINYCRACIYEIWQKEQGYVDWKPEINKDFVFPIYSDGKNYLKEDFNEY